MTQNNFSMTKVSALIILVVFTSLLTSTVNAQRDRGRNQPGAVGNRGSVGLGAPGVGVAPIPGGAAVAVAATPVGYGGSARQVRLAHDPGINQPGAVGNVGGVGVDPGINQPGAVGNVGRDPGINQPGVAGNHK
jgi:hypothetical protein